MSQSFHTRLLGVFVAITAVLAPSRVAQAQEAAVVTALAGQTVRALGKDAVEFGGEAAARETVKRLLAEAGESAGSAGGRVAKAQVERILATGREGVILDLKSLSGRSLPLLEDVTDEALPAAVGTLARPGVSKAI